MQLKVRCGISTQRIKKARSHWCLWLVLLDPRICLTGSRATAAEIQRSAAQDSNSARSSPGTAASSSIALMHRLFFAIRPAPARKVCMKEPLCASSNSLDRMCLRKVNGESVAGQLLSRIACCAIKPQSESSEASKLLLTTPFQPLV